MSAQGVGAPVPEHGRDEPWLGLESYAEADADLFHGREDETDELVRLLRRGVLTVLFGPSGTGKTSLIRAGLFPRLRKEYFLPVPIRLDHSGGAHRQVGQVRSAIAQAVTEHGIEETFTTSGASADETLWEYMHHALFWNRRNDPVMPVLVFDQFEETFTLGKSHAGTADFLTELADLVENYIPETVRARIERTGNTLGFDPSAQHYKVLIAMREDFVSRLDDLSKQMPSLMHNRFGLTRMDGQQALRPVLVPGRGVVSEAVAEQIVRKVASADPEAPLKGLEVDPALLSLMCRELNARRLREGQTTIPAALVNNAASDILEDFYERSFTGLDPRARVFVEDRLLTSEGYRTTVALDAASGEGIREDIDALVNRRLLRAEERLGLPHLELTHDVLTKVALSSRDARQERQRREEDDRRRTAEEAARKAELKRARRLLVAVGSAALACLGLGAMAFVSYRSARNSLVTATRAEEAASVANSNLRQVQRLSRQTSDIGAKSQLSLLLSVQAAAISLEAEPDNPLGAIDVIRQQLRVTGGRPLLGHRARTRMAVFSADRRWLATGSEDGEVRAWNLADIDSERGSFAVGEHRGQVYGLAYSSNGDWLASGGADGVTRVWRIAANGGKPAFEFGRPEFVAIRSVALSPNDEWLVFGTESGNVCVWKMTARGPVEAPCEVGRQTKPVTKAVFSRNGRWLATAEVTHDAEAAWGAEISLWDVSHPDFPREEPKRLVHANSLIENSLQAFAFSADERRLAVAYGYEAQVWDLEQPQPPQHVVRRANHGQWIRTVALSPDNRWLATGSIDTNVSLWDVASPLQEPLVLEGHSASVRSVSFSDEGRWFVSAGDDGITRLWDLRGAFLSSRVLRGQDRAIEQVLFSPGPDPEYALAVGEDVHARLWNIPDSTADPIVLRGHTGPISSAAVSPDGQWIASSGSTDHKLLVWSVVAPRSRSQELQLQMPAQSIAFSANGRWLAAVTGSIVQLWSLPDLPKKVWRLDNGAPAGPASFGFSADSRWLLSGTWTRPGTVNFWDVSVADPSSSPSFQCAQDAPVRALALSVDGHFAVSGSHGLHAYLWDLTAPDPCLSHRSFGPHEDVVAGVAISPDSEWVATASFDGKGRLWQRNAGAPPVAAAMFQNRVTETSFSPDGRSVAFASWDRTITVLDPQAARTSTPLKFPGHDSRVLATIFSPDSRWLVTAGEDRTIRLWDRSDPGAAPIVLRHDGPVTYVGFSKDGRWLISAGGDGTVRLWRLTYADLVDVACRTAGRQLTPEEVEAFLNHEHAHLPCAGPAGPQ